MRRFFVIVAVCISLGSGVLEAAEDHFLVGFGKEYISSNSLGIVMMGYGKPSQYSKSVATPLFARSVMIADPASNKKVVMVVCDIGMISEAITVLVLEKLASLGINDIDEGNLLLMATHTHSGEGGYFLKPFYNLVIGGFSKRNTDQIVNGIVAAIVQSRSDLRPHLMMPNSGPLANLSWNRSKEAFIANSEYHNRETLSERDKAIVDAQRNIFMYLLRFRTLDGEESGMLNWFAVHPTSLANTNTAVSSDNKGLAAELFEKYMTGSGHSNFVAAGFANGELGDVSPCWHSGDESCRADDQTAMQANARGQYLGAKGLYFSAKQAATPKIEYAQRWVELPGLLVEKTYTGGDNDIHLCDSAFGLSFAAGSLDGRGMEGFWEGMRSGDYPANWAYYPLRLIEMLHSKVVKSCHYPKAILLQTTSSLLDLSSRIFPFQLFIVGNVVILGVPGELTTIAGMRLRRHVRSLLGDRKVEFIAIAGLSNSYLGYITTREEYDLQPYDAGHTLFGPNTLAAVIKIFSQLVEDLDVEEERNYSENRPILNFSWPTFIR